MHTVCSHDPSDNLSRVPLKAAKHVNQYIGHVSYLSHNPRVWFLQLYCLMLSLTSRFYNRFSIIWNVKTNCFQIKKHRNNGKWSNVFIEDTEVDEIVRVMKKFAASSDREPSTKNPMDVWNQLFDLLSPWTTWGADWCWCLKSTLWLFREVAKTCFHHEQHGGPAAATAGGRNPGVANWSVS